MCSFRCWLLARVGRETKLREIVCFSCFHSRFLLTVWSLVLGSVRITLPLALSGSDQLPRCCLFLHIAELVGQRQVFVLRGLFSEQHRCQHTGANRVIG